MEYNLSLLFFCGTFLFIVVNFYGWIIKMFYKPKAYYKNFSQLYPAQKVVALLYFVQIFQLPYIFHIGETHYLHYANAISLLSYAAIMAEMYEGYFFLNFYSTKRRILHYCPMAIVMGLFVYERFMPNQYEWISLTTINILTLLIFSYYFVLNVGITKHIRKVIRQLNEATYSNPDNFPTRIAEKVLWLTIIICVALLANLLLISPWSKFCCDILLTGICCWFTFITLDPWRTVFTPKEQEHLELQNEKPRPRLIRNDRAEEMVKKMHDLMGNQKLYTDPDLNVDKLTALLATNRNYMNEVIQQAGYKSFFDMVNHYRVEHAARLLKEHPEESMFQIAVNSGFSSQSYMSRTFKLLKDISPSAYRNANKENS